MDAAQLVDQVESAVRQKIQAQEAFTTAEISHPIIEKDINDRAAALGVSPTLASVRNDPNGVRHRQVRDIIDQMFARGEFDQEAYTTSLITVYPKPNKPVNGVRLFHPDRPDFDPNSYTAVNLVLDRSGSSDPTLSKTRGFDVTDGLGDNGSSDSVATISTTPSGGAVIRQCQIQQKRGSLNIPSILVKSVGLKPGDSFQTRLDGKTVIIEAGIKTGQLRQKVDAEGRIRLHGDNVNALGGPNTSLTAMLVYPLASNGSTTPYIQVQP